VYLGFHSFVDVLAGGLLGLAWAGVCASVAHRFR
jgi:membrane-associated phospholipid phosphatase